MHDLRQSLRSLARQPGLTVTLLLTIALGIGINAAVFGFVRGLVTPAEFAAVDQFSGLRVPIDGLETPVAGVAPPELEGLYTGRAVRFRSSAGCATKCRWRPRRPQSMRLPTTMRSLFCLTPVSHLRRPPTPTAGRRRSGGRFVRVGVRLARRREQRAGPLTMTTIGRRR